MPCASDTHTLTHLSPSQTSCLCSFCQRPRGEGNCCGSRATEHRPDCLLDRDQWAKKCGAYKVQRQTKSQDFSTLRLFTVKSTGLGFFLSFFFSKNQRRSTRCSAFVAETEWPRKRSCWGFFPVFFPKRTSAFSKRSLGMMR